MFVLVTALIATGCEGAPARSKPWRQGAGPTKVEPTGRIAARGETVWAAEADRKWRPELRVAVLGAGAGMRDLDPFSRAKTALWATRSTVYESLARVEAGGVVPELASSIELAADGLSLLIVVRDGVHLHSGKLLTAHDVKVSIDAARGGSDLAAHLRDIIAVELAGPLEVRVRLGRQNSYVARMLAEVPIAAAVRGADGIRSGTGRHRIATGKPSLGASKLAAMVGGSAWRLEAFDAHWSAIAGRLGPIELVTIADPARALAALQVGDVDVARHIRPEHRAAGGGVVALEVAPAHFRYLALNARRSLFSDVEVRRAASLVIDRAALATDSHRGRARPVVSPIWPRGPVSAVGQPPRPPDRRAAAELLDRSGWSRQDGGPRERDGQKLVAVAVTGEVDDAARDLVFDDLRQTGFVLDVKRLAPQALATALHNGAFDVAVLEWRGSSDWDLSPLLESRGRLNFGRVKTAALDAALSRLRGARSSAERAGAAPALAAALEEAVPVVFLTAPIEVAAIGPAVSGYEAAPTTLRLGSLVRAPVEPE